MNLEKTFRQYNFDLSCAKSAMNLLYDNSQCLTWDDESLAGNLGDIDNNLRVLETKVTTLRESFELLLERAKYFNDEEFDEWVGDGKEKQ